MTALGNRARSYRKPVSWDEVDEGGHFAAPERAGTRQPITERKGCADEDN